MMMSIFVVSKSGESCIIIQVQYVFPLEANYTTHVVWGMEGMGLGTICEHMDASFH